MSERIYAWLLRLYPAGFRNEYGEEARRLIRDRLENERGFVQRFAFWIDVIFDLCGSLIHEHSSCEATGVVTYGATNNDAPLQFCILNDGSPSRGALLIGAICSVFVLVNFTFLVGVGTKTPPASGLFYFQRPPVFGLGMQIARAANPGSPITLDSTERKRVIDAISTNLNEHYIDHDMAQKMANTIQAHEKNGAYNSVYTGAEFARLLSFQLRDISHDLYLEVIFSERALSPQPEPPSGVFYRIDNYFGIGIPEVNGAK